MMPYKQLPDEFGLSRLAVLQGDHATMNLQNLSKETKKFHMADSSDCLRSYRPHRAYVPVLCYRSLAVFHVKLPGRI